MKLAPFLLTCSVGAFTAPAARAPRVALRPSSTAEAIDAESVSVAAPSPKEDLMDAVGAAPAGSAVSADLRATVTEAVLALEATNPTEDPATSPLLNGRWDVAFSGYAPGPLPSPTRPLALALYAGGFTPGQAGLALAGLLPDALADAGPLQLTIGRDQPRCEALTSVSLAGLGAQDVTVRTRLEAETGVRLRETYASCEAFGRTVDVPAALQYARKLYVTYVDDDLLVVRDESGAPDVLLRVGQPEGAPLPDEGVPSADEASDDAPGAS